MPSVAVVGGGLAGLSTAYHLEKAYAGTDLAITLFETDDRLGGVLRSERIDGYLIDAGPDSLLADPPAGLALCRELGLESELVPVEAGARTIWIYSRGRLRALPAGVSFLAPDPWAMARSGIFSWIGLVRAGLEPLVPRGLQPADESVADFFRRRVGREVVDRLVEPMMAGIYAGDLERLSAAALLPRLRELVRTHGGLLRGMRQARAARSGGSAGSAGSGGSGGSGDGAAAFFGLRSGMAQLVESLAVRLVRTHARTARPVDLIRRAASGRYSLWDRVGTALGEFDAVAVTVPAGHAGAMLQPLDPQFAGALAGIRYVSTAIVFLGYDRGALDWVPEGHGFFIPAIEHRTLRGATLVTNKFEGRTPPGRFLIRASIGGSGREEIVERTDEEILDRVRADLKDVVGWTAEPRFVRIYRYRKSNAQYEIGHVSRVERITECAERHPGLVLAGAAYHGSGIPAVVADGRHAGQHLAAWLLGA